MVRSATPTATYGQGEATFQAAGCEAGIRKLVDHFYDIMASEPAYQRIYDWYPDDITARDKLARFSAVGWVGHVATRSAVGPSAFRPFTSICRSQPPSAICGWDAWRGRIRSRIIRRHYATTSWSNSHSLPNSSAVVARRNSPRMSKTLRERHRRSCHLMVRARLCI